ncbi:FAD-binding domain-containing protein [Micrococcus porci]|uniref:FAD-binding domain-containing protein n=1 Tax=Micrococcus porci TaxID=2856555 RepID=UPI003CEC5337
MTQPWWEGGPGSENPPDADEANNALCWQWAASSGVDASPFFRIFNPDRHAQRFDPDGAYAAHWLPEAAQSTSGYPEAPVVGLTTPRRRRTMPPSPCPGPSASTDGGAGARADHPRRSRGVTDRAQLGHRSGADPPPDATWSRPRRPGGDADTDAAASRSPRGSAPCSAPLPSPVVP